MEIKQKRYSNRTGFAFGEDELKYSIQDSSGTRKFSVPYMDISRDCQTLEERISGCETRGPDLDRTRRGFHCRYLVFGRQRGSEKISV